MAKSDSLEIKQLRWFPQLGKPKGYPDGWWSAKKQSTGDATGGAHTVLLQVSTSSAIKQYWRKYWSLEGIGVYLTTTNDRELTIQLETGMVSDATPAGGMVVNIEGNCECYTDGLTYAAPKPSETMALCRQAPIWIPEKNLGWDIRFNLPNVNTMVNYFNAWGYIWDSDERYPIRPSGVL